MNDEVMIKHQNLPTKGFTVIHNEIILNSKYSANDKAVFIVAEYLEAYDGTQKTYKAIHELLPYMSIEEIEESWNNILNVGKGE